MMNWKCVGERTRELALVGNQALVEEIGERMEGSGPLRESRSSLKVSQEELQHSREELRALAGQLLTAREGSAAVLRGICMTMSTNGWPCWPWTFGGLRKGEVGDRGCH